MAQSTGQFWNDLERDLADPEFRAEYVLQALRIAAIDRLINELDHVRESRGMSKAELARAIGSAPAAVRRLFAARGNPTLGTLSDVAAVLGMEVTLSPLPRDRVKVVATALAPTVQSGGASTSLRRTRAHRPASAFKRRTRVSG